VPFWGDRASTPAEVAATQLEPSQGVWSSGEAPAGPVLVVVNLDQQLGYAYRNGVLIGWASVSNGRKGYETPTGVFLTLQKDKDHHSSVHHNAAMPYTQRLTWGGVALHAGGLPGYPSSHGCVHLPSAFAEKLFDISPMGMTVVVARGSATPQELAHPLPVSPVDPRTGELQHEPRLAAAESWRWTPQAAPAGPLALVVSRADQRVVVLRNEVEIGRARVSIVDTGQAFGTHAFAARADAGGSGAVAGGGLGTAAGAGPGQHARADRRADPAADHRHDADGGDEPAAGELRAFAAEAPHRPLGRARAWRPRRRRRG
jgi:hypothetical protein